MAAAMTRRTGGSATISSTFVLLQLVWYLPEDFTIDPRYSAKDVLLPYRSNPCHVNGYVDAC